MSRSEDVQSLNTPGSSKFSSGLTLERGPSSSTPKQPGDREVTQEQPFMKLLNEISSKVSHMQAEMSAIKIIQQDLQQVRSDISELKATFNTKLDHLNNRMDDIDTRVSAVEHLGKDVEELKSQVKELLNERYKNEQWVRRSNIQINGIPEKAGENLLKIVKCLADHSGFSLNPESDIDFATRVAVKNDTDQKKTKPIIVKMQSRYKKDDFLSSLRKMKHMKASDIGFLGSDSRVYFNDHLSAQNKYLLQKAKIKAKEKNYAFCWVRNCTIMVRKSDKSPVIHITTEESLNKIV